MGAIAAAAEGYTRPSVVLTLWLDNKNTPKRAAAVTRLQSAEAVLDSVESQKQAEDGSSGRLGNPELKNARAAVTRAKRELEEAEKAEREHAHLIRFEKVDGLQWSNIAQQFPPRPGNNLDAQIATNWTASTLVAAKVSGRLLVKDPEGTVEHEGVKYRPDALDDDDWATIETIGAGFDLHRITWANLELNVLNASSQLGRLVKD